MSQFDFLFLEIGQGDCCFVRCPDGRVVVVDCGRTSDALGAGDFGTFKEWLRGADFLCGRTNIDAMILTHPDGDHHNKALDLLQGSHDPAKPMPALSVEDLYVSAGTPDGPLAMYGAGTAFGANVYSNVVTVNRIHDITINFAKKEQTIWNLDASGTRPVYATSGATSIISKYHEVFSGTVGTDKWSVQILASNVLHVDGHLSNQVNAGSIVTRFSIGGRRALIMGDATESTEAFLVDQQKSRLKNMDLVQIPHHGSESSSTAEFVGLTNPTEVVVSVGFLEHVNRLPRYTRPISNWLEKMYETDEDGNVQGRGNIHDNPHPFDYWTQTIDGDETNEQPSRNKLHAHWNEVYGRFGETKPGFPSSFSYAESTKAQDCVGYKVQGQVPWFLFREVGNAAIRMTAHGSQHYTLNTDGAHYVETIPTRSD
ncbi:hypothetical protein GC176_21270 [bacterium]|nr:hypothetical protein [bacterium]